MRRELEEAQPLPAILEKAARWLWRFFRRSRWAAAKITESHVLQRPKVN